MLDSSVRHLTVQSVSGPCHTTSVSIVVEVALATSAFWGLKLQLPRRTWYDLLEFAWPARSSWKRSHKGMVRRIRRQDAAHRVSENEQWLVVCLLKGDAAGPSRLTLSTRPNDGAHRRKRR